MDNLKFSHLLNEAISKPGIISEAYSMFHNYSIGNQILAYTQLDKLEPIATYKKWQELGRNVKKGEKSNISLCMPVTISKKNDAGEKTGEAFQTFVFKRNWFSLSQTEGQDYEHEQINPEWDADLALKNLDIAAEKFSHIDGNWQGYSFDRTIAINPLAKFPHKTRFHELAHVLLGHTIQHTMTDSEHTPANEQEVQAESVAYICCSILNLDGLAESRGYIQSWLKNQQISEKSAQKIFSVADKILKAGNPDFVKAE